MSPQIAPRPRLQSRRSFLGMVPAAVGLVAAGGIRSVFGRSQPVPVRRCRPPGPTTPPHGRGAGAGTAPPPGRTAPEEIAPPAIRIPQLIADGRISPGQTIDVQIKTKHPSRTGLEVREGKFVQASEPLYLDRMNVFYGDAQVSQFMLTSALSDNPFIAFRLRAHAEDLLRVVLTNNRGQRFEAAHPIRFS